MPAKQKSNKQWLRDPAFGLHIAGELREHFATVKARAESNGGVTNAVTVRLLQLQRAILQLERNASNKMESDDAEELVI